ncbi:MAG TPA: S9 family peptidase [Bacteroidota bacterium]|nr:S9 family peptidase [Bacteroidota bacterium]
MFRLTLLSILMCVFAAGVSAQKRALTIRDLYHVKSVDDPQISPDDSRILITVHEDFLEKGKGNTDIYEVKSDGSGLRQMTENPATDDAPRWSPDGKSILFVSTRGGSPQAYLLPADGGEAQVLTDFATGVGEPLWLADGKRFVFTSDVYPECGADNDCNKKNDASLSDGPLQAHMADHLLYRHWTSWKDGTQTHTLVFTIAPTSIKDLTAGDFDSPSFSLGGGGTAVAPDGKELCVVSNHDPVEAQSTNGDLWIVPTDGGPMVDITAENKAYDGDPAYSPDGRYIAYRTQATPGYESDMFRIAVYDRKSRSREILTGAFDNWVDQIKWAPDSRSIYFLADVKGHDPLYNIDIASKAIRLVLDAKTIDAFDVSHDGKWIAFIRRSVAEPRELWTVRTDGTHLRQLTFFNKPVTDSVDVRPAMEMWIPSPTGKMIQTFIVTPHGFDPAKKYPLILNVHGGPQMQWVDGFRGDWQVYPGAGYIVAFPNPTGSTGEGQEFTAGISKDWGGKVYQDVMAVADSLSKLPYVDANRMGAMGWSFGGYMMMWLEGHTTRFKAIACMMGVYDLPAMHGSTEELWFPEWELNGDPWNSDLYRQWSPNQFVKEFKTPCLVITGERDYRVPYTQSLEFFTDLQLMKVPSRLIVFKNDGHWPSGVKSMPFYYNAHLDWFHKYLGGDPAPFDMTAMLRNQAY